MPNVWCFGSLQCLSGRVTCFLFANKSLNLTSTNKTEISLNVLMSCISIGILMLSRCIKPSNKQKEKKVFFLSHRGAAGLHRRPGLPQTEKAQTSLVCQRRRPGRAAHTLRAPLTPRALPPRILPRPGGALRGWRGQHRASGAHRPLRLAPSCLQKMVSVPSVRCKLH